MNVKEVGRIISENRINTSACLINPPLCREGALCLVQEANGGWKVTLNERGEYLVSESFISEDAACQYFLRVILSDPTYRLDFKQEDLYTFEKQKDAILRKYNL